MQQIKETPALCLKSLPHTFVYYLLDSISRGDPGLTVKEFGFIPDCQYT